ncbi:MAG: hypothetical protein RLZZ318_1428 [Bacteroidota bacterium]
MLFNSYEFILVFLPITLLGFFLIGNYSHSTALLWLAITSLFFYAWWDIQFVPLLLVSILFNYGLSKLIKHYFQDQRTKNRLLILGLIFNLGLILFYKYWSLLLDILGLVSLNKLSSINLDLTLPIGISFYTFTQLAFLVDTWRGTANPQNNIQKYFLFVTYFPHLIAGPVLHHAKMIPQFNSPRIFKINYDSLAVGLTVFALGLSKKVLIADPLGEYANTFFSGVAGGQIAYLATSWIGTISYALQIYFDFSAYSDMAIGISLMFGIRLPINFNSPYQATSLIDFWRRWHISLSDFLRDYLYIPLGGNRLGHIRRYTNLLITMALGGLWHGANWTFLLWGLIHGVCLASNHFIKNYWRLNIKHILFRFLGWLITMLIVLISWVMFRADNLNTALHIYGGMLGINGSTNNSFDWIVIQSSHNIFWQTLLIAILIAVKGPNLNSLILNGLSHIQSNTKKVLLAIAAGTLLCISLLSLHKISHFLYFQF